MDFAAVFGAALDKIDARMAAEEEAEDEVAANEGEVAAEGAVDDVPADAETGVVDDDEQFARWWASREVAAEPAGSGNNGTITLARVIDGVVGTKTLGGYVGDVVQFLSWCQANQEDWVTAYGRGRINQIQRQVPGERARVRARRMKEQIKALLREAVTQPIVNISPQKGSWIL